MDDEPQERPNYSPETAFSPIGPDGEPGMAPTILEANGLTVPAPEMTESPETPEPPETERNDRQG